MNAASSGPTVQKVLLADIGGTNARFALLAGGTVGTIAHMAVRDYGSFREALDKYLGNLLEAGTIRAAILAVSGAVQNGHSALTNNPWVIDAAKLRTACGFSTVRLINDFEAVAWSLPAFPLTN
jgi:glucokinase